MRRKAGSKISLSFWSNKCPQPTPSNASATKLSMASVKGFNKGAVKLSIANQSKANMNKQAVASAIILRRKRSVILLVEKDDLAMVSRTDDANKASESHEVNKASKENIRRWQIGPCTASARTKSPNAMKMKAQEQHISMHPTPTSTCPRNTAKTTV